MKAKNKNKVVLITGASSGIRNATAELYYFMIISFMQQITEGKTWMT
jgi:hypothetical protein